MDAQSESLQNHTPRSLPSNAFSLVASTSHLKNAATPPLRTSQLKPLVPSYLPAFFGDISEMLPGKYQGESCET